MKTEPPRLIAQVNLMGKCKMRRRRKSHGALGNTRRCVRSTGLWQALTYTFPHHKH